MRGRNFTVFLQRVLDDIRDARDRARTFSVDDNIMLTCGASKDCAPIIDAGSMARLFCAGHDAPIARMARRLPVMRQAGFVCLSGDQNILENDFSSCARRQEHRGNATEGMRRFAPSLPASQRMYVVAISRNPDTPRIIQANLSSPASMWTGLHSTSTPYRAPDDQGFEERADYERASRGVRRHHPWCAPGFWSERSNFSGGRPNAG